MPDFRCYCESASLRKSEEIALSPEESNHLIAANRARQGNPVRVFDGNGNEWDATVVSANKRKAVLKLGNSFQIPPPPYRIALAQALPKGKLFESLIRKATEIGIQQIFPLLTRRVESKIDPKRADTKNAKWQAATLEGAKQSGNPHLVSIEPIQAFNAFIASAPDFDLKLIASLAPGAVTLKTHLDQFANKRGQPRPKSILWLVGPEGDFTADETETALASGFLPSTLGPHVMRCETAALFALSITQHELSSQIG